MKNRVLATTLLLCLLTSLCFMNAASAELATYTNEDFGFEENSAPTGWALSNASFVNDNGKKFLRLIDPDASATAYIRHTFQGGHATESLTLRFKLKFVAGAAFSLGLFEKEDNSYSVAAFNFYINGSGNIIAQGSSTVDCGKFAPSANPYQFEIRADIINQRWDLLIDGVKKNSSPITFRNAKTNIGRLQINTSAANIATLELDDVVIREGIEIISEDFANHATSMTSSTRPLSTDSSQDTERFIKIDGDADKYAEIVDNSVGSTAIASYFTFPTQKSKVTVQFDVYINSTASVNIYVKRERNSTAGGAGGYINTAGKYILHSANGSNNIELPAIDLSGWCNFKFVLDRSSTEGAGRGKYDIYITDSKDKTVSSLGNDFRTAMADHLDALMISTSAGAKNTVIRLDNVKVYSGEAYEYTAPTRFSQFSAPLWTEANEPIDLEIKASRIDTPISSVEFFGGESSLGSAVMEEDGYTWKLSAPLPVADDLDITARIDGVTAGNPVTVSAYDASGMGNLRLSERPAFTDGSTVTETVYGTVYYETKFYNTTESPQNTSVIIALYKKQNDELVSVKIAESTVPDGTPVEIRPFISGIENSEDYYLKSFIFDSLGNLKPIYRTDLLGK